MNVFSACVKTSLAALLSLFSVLTLAAEPAALEPINYGARVLFFLVFIIGFIVLLAWLVNKSKLHTHLSGGNEQLKIVASLSLGVKEKLAVVQVGEKQVLVGITGHSINYLTELDEPLTVNAPAPVSFQALLKKAIRS